MKDNTLKNKKENYFTHNQRISFITSVIEFKNYGNELNCLEILENSDSNSIIDFPEILNNEMGTGFIFKSIKGNIDLKVKCKGNGNLKIDFKSLTLKNHYGNNFNIYLKYKNIFINETKIIDNEVYASCTNPFTHQINVKDNDVIHFHIEWDSVNFNTLLNLNYNNLDLLNELRELDDETKDYISQINSIANVVQNNNNLRMNLNFDSKMNVGLIECSDKNAYIMPKKLEDDESSGLLFISSKETVDMEFRCVGDGNLTIDFKESLFQTHKSIKLPSLFDLSNLYTNITVNNSRIGDDETYDSNSLTYSINVKDKDIVQIHVKWKLLDSNMKIYNNNQVLYLTDKLFKLKEEHGSLKEKIIKSKKQMGLIEKNSNSNINIARLDIKNYGSLLNNIHIIDSSDNDAVIQYPDWFNNEKGSGLTFESSKGYVNLNVLCKGNGTLKIEFKGIYLKDSIDNRIQDYVNYTEIIINGKKIINENILTCHDKPFVYSINVKNDDIVSVQFKWKRMDINLPLELERNVDLLNNEVSTFNDFLNNYKDDSTNLINKIYFNLKEIEYLNKNNELYTSFKRLYSKLDNLERIISRKFSTARIDIKNEGIKNKIELLDISDPYCKIEKPAWFADEKGFGVTIESSKRKLKLKFKCINDGKLNIHCRGIDFRDYEGNRVPIYIDLTDIVVNGKKIIAENTLISHDEPLFYSFDVKNGDVINIQANWKPINPNTPILAYNAVLDLFNEIKHYSLDEPVFKDDLIQKSLKNVIKYPFVNKINTARFDIKNEGSENNSIEVYNCSDDDAIIYSPKWFNKGNGFGLIFESSKGHVDLDLLCKGDGKLNIHCRSVDFKNHEGNRVPIYIDLTDIVVNGKKIIAENTLISHDEPLFYSIDVKDGDVINIHSNWKPINPNTAIYTNTKINYLIDQIGELKNQFNELSQHFSKLNLIKNEDSINPFLVTINTARFDIKNEGSENNSIEVFNCSDDDAIIYSPEWFNKGNGFGLIFESSKGHVDLDLLCKGDGKLNIHCRTVDFKNHEGNRVPIYIDLTDIVVNGKKIIAENTLISHDEPLFYSIDVKDGDVINIHSNWKPINPNKAVYTNTIIQYLLYSLNQLLIQIEDSKNDLNKSIEGLFVDEENKFKKLKSSIIKSNNLNRMPIFDNKSPLVSIIILNHNGEEHIKRLIPKLEEIYDDYPNVEVILVDNNSNDDYKQYLSGFKRVPYKLIENKKNHSFSYANNQAVKKANGEYILFLNNDIEPLKGFLNHMMETMLNNDKVGAVGAKLFYPDCTGSTLNSEKSYSIQHAGIIFKESDGYMKPINRNNGTLFEEDKDKKLREIIAVTAAALLIKKSIFLNVNGFDENYVYGYEDVDLCLKLYYNGYTNYYNPNAVLYHYEFGTQEKDTDSEVKERRSKNHEFFIKRWNKWLRKNYLIDKLNSNNIFSDDILTVGFVTDIYDKNDEDYRIFLNLSEEFKKNGWNVRFLSELNNECYKLNDEIDILISSWAEYDLTRIQNTNGLLIKIAWINDNFEKWVSNKLFDKYDIILSSNQNATNYIHEHTGKTVSVYPLATNKTSTENIPITEKYKCDYCLIGDSNNIELENEITKYLNPASLEYNFNLYNLDIDNDLNNYFKGTVDSDELQKVIASTDIILNFSDNNDLYSFNSNVFDAISQGKLVLTNNIVANKEFFDGKIPEFNSKEDLTEKLSYYLSNPHKMKEKINILQKIISERHMFSIRFNELKEILIEYIEKPKIAIKTSVRNWNQIKQWGDYHLAKGLEAEFIKKGYEIKIQILSEWNDGLDSMVDYVLVLRGLYEYVPKVQHFNIIWNISHPDLINFKEFESYDYIFIASKSWSKKIANIVDTPVSTMLQCTDTKRFYPDYDEEYKTNLLFVGNSRGVYRKILKDLIPTKYNLSVYGNGWEDIIDEKYVKGEHIDNKELRKAYSSCDILLNDHWEDMREKGFISNRIFDAVACGSKVISDDVAGLSEIFPNRIFCYKNSDDLNNIIDKLLKEKINYDVSEIKGHTYKDRVNQIIDILP